ncbi:MAG TPA: hypothetical protein VL361_20940 [Candidatus Limnocylindrales bacterium]|jgi:hypothetical protein|nr:hypothetical protein [Candidatus Limnocylindrales bacterium]
MKRIALILGIALTLSSSTGNVRAHGGCYGFWPLWPLALGAGIAIASAASAHSSPTYVYAPPAYPYGYYPQPHYSNPQPSQSAPATAVPAVQTFEQAVYWVPSSPGVGHWVRDPEPYNYEPGVQTKVLATGVAPVPPIVLVTRSPSNVPIYVVTR